MLHALVLMFAVRQAMPERVTIDWTAGRLEVIGAGAPDLRAPNGGIARVGAERRARLAAAKRLAEAAKTLPLASGGTVGDLVTKDEAAQARLDAALAHAKALSVVYASDGAVEVVLGGSLEGIREAVAPPATPIGDDASPTAIVVSGAAAVKPVLGMTVNGVALPTIYVPADGAADPRIGARPFAAKLTSAKDGALEIDLSAERVKAAAAAGALLVIVGGAS